MVLLSKARTGRKKRQAAWFSSRAVATVAMKDATFQLPFDPLEIDSLEKRYLDPDGISLSAGRRIKRGDYSPKNLDIIYRWKTHRHRRRIGQRNTDAEIKRALRSAVNARSERDAVRSLCGLEGVDVQVASAVLTAVDPERYTIVDFCTLASLGIRRRSRVTINFYVQYLERCRTLAKQLGVSLRKLHRAICEWSKEQE